MLSDSAIAVAAIAIGAIRSPGAIALIGAIAGVLGGIAGALSGGYATYRIEQQRQQFERRRDLRAEQQERDREAAVIRGIARVWATRLDDFRHLVKSWGPDNDTSIWWPEAYDEDFSLSVDDMKRVAGVATAEQWGAIDLATNAVRSIVAARAFDEAEAELGDHETKIVVDNLELIDDGILALDEIAK